MGCAGWPEEGSRNGWLMLTQMGQAMVASLVPEDRVVTPDALQISRAVALSTDMFARSGWPHLAGMRHLS